MRIRSIGFPELKLLRPFEVSLSRFRAGETIDSTGIESEHKSQRGTITFPLRQLSAVHFREI